MRKDGLDKEQAWIKIARRNINNLRYADITLLAETEEELKNLLMEVKRREWKTWLKAQHSKKRRSWHLVPSLNGKQMGGEWKQWQTLFWRAPKSLQMIAAMKLKDTCSLEVMTNRDSILKSRGITWPTKVRLVKAMVLPVIMYECESWTIKKAECQRIDAFELWCWRRLLKVPWIARRSTQLILKEISPE